MMEYLKGYEEFISRVEKSVIEKLFPPEKIPEVFEVTLPFAIAFGEAERWSEAFEGLFTEPPRWYESRGSFSTIYFANSLNTFTSQATHALTTQPRSSSSGSRGGGFSGGGGGGGGGGSW
ncbi:putative membrane protein [Thermodesulfovibrio sp. N1]|nr:putative membrane protein [Thermodesulfovibrio sp. N1]